MSNLRVPVGQDDHVKGNPDAPLEIVEYGDFQCPYCGEAYPQVKALQQRLGNKARFVFRNFPLTQIHKYARAAAIASEAAGAQGKFWEMHDILFENQDKLTDKDLFRYAEKIGLDMNKFRNDFENQTFASKVDRDFEGGIRSGVNNTPSFYVNGQKQDDLNEEELLEVSKTARKTS